VQLPRQEGELAEPQALIGLIGHTSEPLELAIREVGHKAIMKTLNTRAEELNNHKRGEHRLSILRPVTKSH
jgi:hypothetical protein